MVTKEFKTLGHKINYSVPADSTEFNSLDKTRLDACCEEATNSVAWRSMHPEFRNLFLHGREAVEAKDGNPAVSTIIGVEELIEQILDGVKLEEGESASRATKVAKNSKGETRMRDGEEVVTFDETEDTYYKRAIALCVKYKKFASEDAVRAHFQSLADSIAATIAFDPTKPEPSEKGPKKLAAKYKIAAAKAIVLGTVPKVNKAFKRTINEEFTPSGDQTKVYEGKYPHRNEQGQDVQIAFTVSDKDAEVFGWLIKKHQDWKANHELETLAE